MSSRGAEKILDRLLDGVGTAHVEGNVPHAVDEAVLAVRDRFGQRRVEPPLGRSALVAGRDNKPAPGRSHYLVSPILFPPGEIARPVSRTARAAPSSLGRTRCTRT